MERHCVLRAAGNGVSNIIYTNLMLQRDKIRMRLLKLFANRLIFEECCHASTIISEM
jgi:hypothetical protein